MLILGSPGDGEPAAGTRSKPTTILHSVWTTRCSSALSIATSLTSYSPIGILSVVAGRAACPEYTTSERTHTICLSHDLVATTLGRYLLIEHSHRYSSMTQFWCRPRIHWQ